MSYIDWSIKGPEIAACNCDWGCPCQFNSLPTHGDCRAAGAFRVDKGHFGDIRLDGLKAAFMVAWPGAVHEGNGECLPIIDEAADEQQRQALLTILSGGETEPGATVFNVFAATYATVHDPRFLPIEFDIDIQAGTGRFAIPGLVTEHSRPITNPMTGEPHRAKVTLAQGFEFTEAEFVSSQIKGNGPVTLDWDKGHSHLTLLHLNPYGVVR